MWSVTAGDSTLGRQPYAAALGRAGEACTLKLYKIDLVIDLHYALFPRQVEILVATLSNNLKRISSVRACVRACVCVRV